MCTHQKYVHNKYIHKSILVSCGKCESCLQQKANARAMRIRNHGAGQLCLFVTLTYDNKFVPYVNTSDLVDIDIEQHRDIQLFRDCNVRQYNGNIFIKSEKTLLNVFSSHDFPVHIFDVPQLVKKPNCTGVIFWPDLKNFIKRLRINLNRNNYDDKITYFAVGEYGKDTHRPHFHLLIFFPTGTIEELRPFIIKSWLFGDLSRSRKRIQEAVNASSYVASYVNKSATLPKILESPAVRQKHSHSLYFGHDLQCFSLPSLLEKADRQDMCYRKEIFKNGYASMATLPIPAYIIDRYFPKFKGYSSLTTPEVIDCLSVPWKLWDKLGFSRFNLIGKELQYTFDYFKQFVNHLSNCVSYYISVTGKTVYDYAIDYVRVWQSRWNYIFRHSYDTVQTLLDFGHYYENINEFLNNPSLAPSLPSPSMMFYEPNPNKRKFIVTNDRNLVDLFRKKEYTKSVNSFVLSHIDETF